MLIYVDLPFQDGITDTSTIHRDRFLSLDLENFIIGKPTTISQRLLVPVSTSLCILCNFCHVILGVLGFVYLLSGS